MGKPKTQHNRTSTKGKTFPAGKGGTKTKSSSYQSYYPALTKKDYYDIAVKHNLGYGDREAYIEFMTRRFSHERDKGYATEWAERFKNGTQWGHCDTESEGYLLKAYRVKSAKDKWK